jgi:hypothetical protein
MIMSLQNWLNNGWLTEHWTSSQEITALLGVADRDLTDCKTSGLSPDWQLNIAYNAALQMATAALVASGYRAVREAHHYRVIQSLAHTVQADNELIALFDQFRKKRNISGYDHAGMISDQEAKEMVDLASRLRLKVEEWLYENHPNLMKE